MFGKKPSDPKAALADRVRVIAERARPAPPMAKAARAERTNVFKSATITLDSGIRYTVAIKDVSVGGVRVEFAHDITLDDVFTISEPMLKLRRRARLAWRLGGAAGLVFVD